jgi:predicted dehydrogenase
VLIDSKDCSEAIDVIMSRSQRFVLKTGQRFWQRVMAGGLGTLIWLGSGAISLTPFLTSPPPAYATTSRLTLFVTRNPAESYESFLRQSEAIARAGIQRSFDADPLISEVIVTVVGNNQEIAVPIMEVQVSRNEWQQRPDPQYWAEYYTNASVLLDL